MTTDPAAGPEFWRLPLAELEKRLGDSPGGLSTAEAVQRLERYGPNVMGQRRRYGLALKVASRFRNPLVLILIAAALISAATGEISNCIIISAIVLMSVALDSLQELRAETAADRLKSSVALARPRTIHRIIPTRARRVHAGRSRLSTATCRTF